MQPFQYGYKLRFTLCYGLGAFQQGVQVILAAFLYGYATGFQCASTQIIIMKAVRSLGHIHRVYLFEQNLLTQVKEFYVQLATGEWRKTTMQAGAITCAHIKQLKENINAICEFFVTELTCAVCTVIVTRL